MLDITGLFVIELQLRRPGSESLVAAKQIKRGSLGGYLYICIYRIPEPQALNPGVESFPVENLRSLSSTGSQNTQHIPKLVVRTPPPPPPISRSLED